MVRWHHQLNGHGFGWTPGVGDGQGGLVCCRSWCRKESDKTSDLAHTHRQVEEGKGAAIGRVFLGEAPTHTQGLGGQKELSILVLKEISVFRVMLSRSLQSSSLEPCGACPNETHCKCKLHTN